MQTIHIVRPVLGALGLLLVPLVAMQVSAEVSWTLSDFVVMGALLVVTALLIETALAYVGKYRYAAIAGIVFLFLWLWAELAVGVFTTWGS